jgi:hypothetical protein
MKIRLIGILRISDLTIRIIYYPLLLRRVRLNFCCLIYGVPALLSA